MSSYDQAVLADAPQLYIAAAQAVDASGHGRSVVAHGAPGSIALPNGDAALWLDSSGTQYLEAADVDAYSIPTTGALTIECWMTPGAVNQPHALSSGYVDFFGKAGYWNPPGTNQYEWQLRYFNQNTTDSGNPGEAVCGYVFNLIGGRGAGYDYTGGVVVGRWEHFVEVVNTAPASGYPNGYVKLYHNGQLIKTDTLAPEDFHPLIIPGNGTAPVTIGACELQEADVNFWYGGLGKAAIYSGELAAARILAHYNAMANAGATASDSVAVSDHAIAGTSGARSAIDTVAISDSAVIIPPGVRAADDMVGVGDAIASTQVSYRAAEDMLAVIDSASILLLAPGGAKLTGRLGSATALASRVDRASPWA